jgi:hypothetical protein
MEALIFLLNAVGVVILVVTSLKNDKRKPQEPMIGPFRFVETLTPPKPKRMPASYLAGRSTPDA